ncbi:Growth arrest-specific protein 8 [Pteropus alecto]|uniref:Growth arrest-specific protein 8 n=1 Tax=Pteropus alecto TaxID=9402 RepID=L5KFG9_PTEAL|nr:Growth arrest-specific protein 8 [Pteropus alecto]
MKMLRDELDLRRKTEIHEVEERKNGQINMLMRRHEEAFTDMENYNDITLNNLALINSLKVPRGPGRAGVPTAPDPSDPAPRL